MDENRAIILLKACLDFLNKHRESPYELEVLRQTVMYDDVECDGYCLIDDIEAYLLEYDIFTMKSCE